MHDLKRLKDMLVKELEEYGKSGNVSKSSLDYVDKLAHATKNLAKVIEACEAEEAYSNAMEGRYSREDRASYADNSYGYSRSDSNLHGQLYRLMETSKDPRTKEEIRNLLERI